MKKLSILLGVFVFITLTSEECSKKPESASGVAKATAVVSTNLQGETIEQYNLKEKAKRDSEIGKIRHLYQISAYTGEVLEYNTVKGKITSGGKRLNPKNVVDINGNSSVFKLSDGVYTGELQSDDGVYGDSMPYFFFFDTKDEYHQIFPTGGTYVHISDRPLTIKKSSLIFQ